MSGIQSTVSPGILLPPKTIVNACSGGGASVATIDIFDNCKAILSGALTAATLSTALTVNGPGVLAVCYLRGIDATARTLRLQITIDGTVVFDDTSGSLTDAATAVIGVGALGSKSGSSLYPVLPLPTAFNAQLLVKIASSLSETDKLQLRTQYQTC